MKNADTAIAKERLDDNVTIFAPERFISAISRLINVGGIRSGKWVISSFSGAFRTSAGLFTTSVSGADAQADALR